MTPLDGRGHAGLEQITTATFIALAESVSGRQLDSFFDVWLYRPGKPQAW